MAEITKKVNYTLVCFISSGGSSLDICIAYSPDSKIIATAGDNSTIYMFDASGGKVGTLAGHRGWIWGLEFTTDGKYLISCSSDRTVKVSFMKI